MSLTSFIIKRFIHKSFQHGIHADDHKQGTQSLAIHRLPFAPKLYIPLNQHIGSPSEPVVLPGQEVTRGQVIAKASGGLSVPVHAPATGIVEDIRLMPSAKGSKTLTIVLKVYQADSQEILHRAPLDPASMSPKEIIQAIQDSGLVGLGGAAFPTHAKMQPPKEHIIDTFVVNGCECEPYLTTDHRIMLEKPKQLIAGIRIALKASGAKQAVIGVEDNKTDAIGAIRSVLEENDPIRVQAVKTKYPQGAEKLLIKVLLNRVVPSGGHSYDVGVVCNNAGTMAQLGELFARGHGLIERVVTIDGPNVEKPGNYIIPIGTPVGFVLQQVGIKKPTEEIILGGPMMGNTVSSLDTPITKGVSGVLIFDEANIAAQSRKSFSCIKCGQCLKACPLFLNPAQLAMLAMKREYTKMQQEYHLNDCFECGCCTYVCPAGIPLVQYVRVAKSINREAQQKAA